MRFIWISARKDLHRLRRDPSSVLTWVAIPVMLILLMRVLFGGGQVTPQGRLLVADEDDTVASGLLTGAFGRGPMGRMVLVEKVAQADGRRRMERGEASALLVIPAGFQSAFLARRPFHLQLVTNPQQTILPKIIEETLSITVEGGNYLQRVAGDQLSAFNSSQPPSDANISQWSVAANQTVSRLRRYLDPPLIELETSVVQEETQAGNFIDLYFRSTMFMALLFVARALAEDIWEERTQATLRRTAAAPVSLRAFLGGRLLFVCMVFAGVALVGLVAMRYLSDMRMSTLPGAALWLVFSGAVFYLALLLVAMSASNRRTADLIANLVVFPLVLLGGSFFPFEMMPDWMAAIGRWTPNGWAVEQFRDIVTGAASWRSLAPGAAAMGAAGIALFALAARRMRRGFLV